MAREEAVSKLSLYWRVVVANAIVFALGTAVLALSPATVSFPVALAEGLVLGAGLAAILLANAFLLRLTFRPLDRLTGLMRRIDLLRPGQRLSVSGASEVAEVIRTFNDMLDRLEAERRSSSGRALMAQEAERQRIAQELHDEIGQSLTAVLLQLKRVAANAPADVRRDLLDAQETARGSLDEVRRIARRLRPGVLEDLGLVSALGALGRSFSEQTGLPVERRFERSIPSLSEEVELALYRVAQEGLTNVARHAGASRVQLSLERSPRGVVLRMADDGQGLNGAPDGDGLRGMRERAILIGGHLSIESRPRGGVEITLEAPVDEAGG
jgi:two-component system, NarL family, sensor histidine kinase UhpB